MKTNSVYIEGSSGLYATMFMANGWDVVDNIQQADLMLFTGGEDVTPALYGCERMPVTKNNLDRDLECVRMWNYCLAEDIAMAGICRGAQFLNVMNCGSLYQDVTGHVLRGTHPALVLDTGEHIDVTSTHHQMMISGPNAKVLMTANLNSHKTYYANEGETSTHSGGNDPEALYYEHSNSLCYQPHPEYCNKEHKCQSTFFEFLFDYLM